MLHTLGLLLAMTLPGQASTPQIVGHRGASYDAPENTLASVNLGWKQNADAVEIDVFLSMDGRIMVCHDKNTKRVAGVDKDIVNQTAEELRKLDVGRWKNEKFAGEKMPFLEEVLATIPSGKRLLIEVKCGPEIVPTLKNVLSAAGKPSEETVIISFNDQVIAACKEAMPQLKALWIVGLRQDKETGEWTPKLDALLARAAQIKADGLDLSARPVIDAAYGKKIKDAGLELHVWTVNDPELARQMIAAGTLSITTDRPAWLREQLNEKK